MINVIDLDTDILKYACLQKKKKGNLVLLWLWHRPAAVAPIRPLAWEPPCAVGVALKSNQKNNNNNFFLGPHLRHI